MTKLSKESVLLFTGGGKGITAQCAIALSAVFPCTYLLLGRSQRTELPDWLEENASEQEIKRKILAEAKHRNEKLNPKEIERKYRQISGNLEIAATLRQIEENGAVVRYLSADVTDQAHLQQVLDEVTAQVGPITGLVHGAGRLADKRIERKTEADFDAVYGTKVDGLKAVLNCLQGENLDLLVLFSSVAGAFGNAGQADYAMANEYLNKFAFQFQQQYPQCHTVSINWGPWDSGMVTPVLKEAFSQMGITLISMQEGIRQFVEEVMAHTHENPQIVYGNKIERPIELNLPEKTVSVRRVIFPDENPFLLDHQIGPNRVLPATCAASWIADTCEKLFPSYHFFELRNYRVMKGLVFEDSQSSEYEVKVDVVQVDENDTLELNVLVISDNEGREITHYCAGIIMKQNIPTTPIHAELAAKASLPVMKDGAFFYKEKVLFHGPAFRGLQSILRVTEDELTTICHLADVPVNVQGQFPAEVTNPYANDVVLQGILAWSYHNHEKVCLPAGIERIIQYIPLPFDRDIFVDVKITSQTRTRARADAVIFDENGRVYMEAEGIEGTMSKALRALFKTARTSLDTAEEQCAAVAAP